MAQIITDSSTLYTIEEAKKAAAKILEFEHAAYLRDRINKLRGGK